MQLNKLPHGGLILAFKKLLSPTQYIYFLSVLVGIISGAAAILLKTIVFYVHRAVEYLSRFPYQKYILVVLPLIGILLTVAYIKIFLKGKFGKGSGHILYSIAKKGSIVEKETMYTHIITSAITVGLGGSAGLESPIVVTGSAIGSNCGQAGKLSYRDRTLMIACGAAAGIAAVFNAPIAGVMFAIEVLIADISFSAFIPLIVAASAGALLSKIFLGESILLHFSLQQPFNYYNVPFYILLGIVTGLVSVLYIRGYSKIENLFKPLHERGYKKALIGGTLLGLLIIIFPPLLGEGYSSIKILAGNHPEMITDNSIFSSISGNAWLLLLVVFFIGLLKIAAASLTIGSGGNGGNFAPSLFLGSFAGFSFARLINQATGTQLPVSNFTIVGMAGILCGVMHAPLTGIFLIAEITGGYELMIPLMIVSAITYMIVRHFEPFSLDKRELANEGALLTRDKDKNILFLMDAAGLIETDYEPVSVQDTIQQLTEKIENTKHDIFPVLDENKKLLGLILLDEIRNMLFDLNNFSEIFALELMSKPQAVIEKNESLESIVGKFESTGAWKLPVVDNGTYIGFISRGNLLSKYRQKLRENFSEEI